MSYGDYYLRFADEAAMQAAMDTGTAAAVSTIYKVAFAYGPNSFAVSLNGGAVVSDTAGTVPSVDRLRLGAGDVAPLFGHLRRVMYYPTRVPDAQLPGLSQ